MDSNTKDNASDIGSQRKSSIASNTVKRPSKPHSRTDERHNSNASQTKIPVALKIPTPLKAEGALVPYEKGDRTMKCWNCETILLIKDVWNIVQCPNCSKMNKIPKIQTELETALKNISYNSYINHFDTTMPYVHVIVVCPFCKTDNRVRKNSEHMVCYRCHNSINIDKEKDDPRPKNSLDPKSKYYRFNQPQSSVNYPPPKTLRISDMFFPDPMFYPGYYPINSISPLYPEYFRPYGAFDPNSMEFSNYVNRRAEYEIFKRNLRLDRKLRNSPNQGKIDFTAVKEKLKEIDETVANMENDSMSRKANHSNTRLNSDNEKFDKHLANIVRLSMKNLKKVDVSEKGEKSDEVEEEQVEEEEEEEEERAKRKKKKKKRRKDQ